MTPKTLAVLAALTLALLYATQFALAENSIAVTKRVGSTAESIDSMSAISGEVSPSVQPQKITSALQAEMQGANPDEKVRVLVEVEDVNSFAIPGAGIVQPTAAMQKISGTKTRLNSAANYAEALGGTARGKYPIGRIVSVDIPKSKIEELTKSGDVKNIWPDRKVYPSLDVSVPNISAPGLWAKGIDGAGVTIAILDTGIDKAHPMLSGKVVAEKYFSGTDITPCNSHGTHVAGIAAGTKANGGIYNGVAPGALIMNGKVLGEGSNCTGWESQIIAGINWAVDPDGNPETKDGANVISMSLGGPYSDPFGAESIAIKGAVDAGVAVVVAAGNCGAPCGTSNYIGVTTPGVVPYAITVGAVNDINQHAYFSSGGNIPDVGIKPDVSAPGVGITSSVPGNAYAPMSGTSMATPHVSGAVALIIQANPGIKPDQIKALLEYTAIDLGTAGKDTEYGSGAINLTGITDPRMLVSPTALSWSLPISKSFVRYISIINYGAKAILVSNITTDGKTTTNFTNSFYLQPMESKTIRVEVWPPLAGLGIFNGYVSISSDSITPKITVPIKLDIYQSEEPVFYDVQMPKTLFRNDVVSLVVNATDNKAVAEVTASITSPTNEVTVRTLQSDADGLWKTTFTAGNITGKYLVNLAARDNDGYNSTYETGYDVQNILVSIPGETVAGKNASFAVRYKNIKDAPSEYSLVYVITDWLDMIEQTGTVGPKDIIADASAWFNWTWAPQKTGTYKLRAYMYENGAALEFMERNITSLVEDIADITNVTITPAAVEKGRNITFVLSARNNGSDAINGTAEFDVMDSNGNIVYVALSETKSMLAQANTTFLFETAAILPGGNYTLSAKLHYGNRVEEKTAQFEIITPKIGKINSISIPPIEAGGKSKINVTFENTGTVPVTVNVKGDVVLGERYDLKITEFDAYGTDASLMFDGAGEKTVYVSLPKSMANANITSAALNVEGQERSGSYPKNVKLDAGSDGMVEWKETGQYRKDSWLVNEDSLGRTKWTETFTGNGDKAIWNLTVDKYANTKRSEFNLQGILSRDYTQLYLFYKENRTSGGASGAGWSNVNNIADADWSTYGECTSGLCYYYPAYIKPVGALSAKWEVQTQSGRVNISLPQICFDSSSSYLYLTVIISAPTTTVDFICNGVSYYEGSGVALWEEGVWWTGNNISVYPKNLSIDLLSDGNIDKQFSGALKGDTFVVDHFNDSETSKTAEFNTPSQTQVYYVRVPKSGVNYTSAKMEVNVSLTAVNYTLDCATPGVSCTASVYSDNTCGISYCGCGANSQGSNLIDGSSGTCYCNSINIGNLGKIYWQMNYSAWKSTNSIGTETNIYFKPDSWRVGDFGVCTATNEDYLYNYTNLSFQKQTSLFTTYAYNTLASGNSITDYAKYSTVYYYTTGTHPNAPYCFNHCGYSPTIGFHEGYLKIEAPNSKKVTLDVGFDGNIESNSLFASSGSYTLNFTSGLTEYLAECTADSSGICTVPIAITTNVPANYTLHNIEINYTVNPIDLTEEYENKSSSDCGTDTCTIPISISSETAGKITISDINMGGPVPPPDMKGAVKKFVASCAPDASGNCHMPIKVSSDVSGIILLKGLNIQSSGSTENATTSYITFGTEQVNASDTKTFSANWTAPASVGNYTLAIKAQYEGNQVTGYALFEVKDTTPPNITSISFKPPAAKNEPVIVAAEISDNSAIALANLNVIAPERYTMPLEKSGNNYKAVFSETAPDGTYAFSVESCDAYGNCATSANNKFVVAPCTGESMLVVSTRYGPENDTFYEALKSKYCVALWNKPDAGSPTAEYLKRFGAVVWSTGSTQSGSLTENDTAMLANYTAGGGKLVLEGDDILFRFGGLAENITHARLSRDLIYTAAAINSSGEAPNKNILVTLEHPVTKNILKEIPFNITLSPYPDSLRALDGTSIAGWSDGGSALVIFNDITGTGSMAAYVPFNIDAIGSEKTTLIQNIAEWIIATNKNLPNIKAESIRLPVLVQDAPAEYYIVLSNTGQASAGTSVSVSVDGTPADSFTINLNAGEKKEITRQMALGLGAHEIEVFANRDFSLKEEEYLDNSVRVNVSAISTKPDLAVTSLSFDGNPVAGTKNSIIATVKNLGGGRAENAGVAIYAGGVELASEAVTLEPLGNTGDEANITATWRATAGRHEIKVIVDGGNAIGEPNETDNELAGEIYGCNVLKVVVVYDDDAGMSATEGRDTTGAIVGILRNNSYCVSEWKESEKGVPSAEYLNAFDAIIWSSGNRWGKAIDAEDESVVGNITTNIIFEGQDIAFDHDGDNFSANVLQASFQKDIILSLDNYSVNVNDTRITNITSVELDSSIGPYPDAVLPSGGSASAAIWNGTNTAAIISYEDGAHRKVFYAFTIDSVRDSSKKEALLLDGLRWAGPKTGAFIRPLEKGWNLISIPRQYLVEDLEAHLGSIEGKYTFAAAWNSSKNSGEAKWMTYDPRRPAFFNDFKKISPATGFWIFMNESGTLTLAGKIPEIVNVTLSGAAEDAGSGWNLVGYTGQENTSPDTALFAIKDKIRVVFGNFEPPNSWESYIPNVGGTIKAMKPGYGYWIKMNTTNGTVLEWN